jgi:hypothetical protein
MKAALLKAAVNAVTAGKTRSEFIAKRSESAAIASRAFYAAEPIVSPELKFEGKVGTVAKARKDGMRWERIAYRTGLSVTEVKELARKSKRAADLSYTGKGTPNVKSLV